MKLAASVVLVGLCVAAGACNLSGSGSSSRDPGMMDLNGPAPADLGEGQPVQPELIAGIPDANGIRLLDSFILTPCLSTALSDCITAPVCSFNPTVPLEQQGLVTQEVFQLGGETDRIYKMTVRVNGIAEAKYYTGGNRAAGVSPITSPDAPEGTDTFYTGGEPVDLGNFNIYKFVVKDAAGSEFQHYSLNSFPRPGGAVTTTYEGHQTYPIAFTHDIAVPGGGSFTLYTADRNCHAVDNCGPGFHPVSCAPSDGRMLPNEPGLTLPATYLGKPVTEMNTRNGSVQPYHSQLFHITVMAAAAL